MQDRTEERSLPRLYLDDYEVRATLELQRLGRMGKPLSMQLYVRKDIDPSKQFADGDFLFAVPCFRKGTPIGLWQYSQLLTLLTAGVVACRLYVYPALPYDQVLPGYMLMIVATSPFGQ